MTDVTVSLIVHQNFAHIERALTTLFAHTDRPLRVYVVVNQGGAEDIARLRAAFPQVTVLVNTNPQGFAANHNQIMRIAQTPYVALLNDDIEVHPQAIDLLCDYLDEHHDVGLVGASLLNPNGTPQVSVYGDPILPLTLYKISGLSRFTAEGTALRQLLQRLKVVRIASWVEQTETREVAVVKGVAMVVRRAASDQVGLMDESTRMYGEEIDWHLRFRKCGWKVAFVAPAKVTHYGIGQRINLATLPDDRVSLLNYYLKHKPAWQAVVVRAAIILTHAFVALVNLPLDRSCAAAYWRTVIAAIRWQSPSRIELRGT
ncbi:MAG: glycosyltransferase family 2 protein [Anaerolinea sp.]|nr:glycosyltransferase family 2 protein [Anaerolinea sp.]